MLRSDGSRNRFGSIFLGRHWRQGSTDNLSATSPPQTQTQTQPQQADSDSDADSEAARQDRQSVPGQNLCRDAYSLPPGGKLSFRKLKSRGACKGSSRFLFRRCGSKRLNNSKRCWKNLLSQPPWCLCTAQTAAHSILGEKARRYISTRYRPQH